MSRENKRPISVEDLLRLKRAERPRPEFWATFDRELRAKQLAALVEKRPWWKDLARAFGGLTRYQLPLGAMAVLAVTFVAMREYRAPANAIASEAPEVTTTVSASPVQTVVDRSARKPGDLQASMTAPASAVEFTVASVPTPEASPVVPPPENPSDVGPAPATVQADSPSSRYIAENLKAALAAEPMVARGLLSQVRGFETRALPSRNSTVEPLSQMTTPAAARIARLNSAIAVSTGPENGARTSERVARRLSSDGDDRLYESVSRLDARGNKVGWKF